MNALILLVRRQIRHAKGKIKTDLFFTYVKPILEYDVTVWAPLTRCGINKLESIQR